MTTPPDPAGHGQPDHPGRQLLTKHEVAALLGGGITAKTVVRRHRKWGLHAIHVGRELRWSPADVQQWISEHRS